MTAIDTYNEVTLTGKRKYELYPDKILISGSGNMSYEFETSILLTKINPDYIRMRVRPTIAWVAFIVFVLAGFVSMLLVVEFKIKSESIPAILAIFSATALLVAIATRKQVEFARFCSDGYGAVLLNLAQSGPDRHRFDSFVQAVADAIVRAKKSAEIRQPPVADEVSITPDRAT